MNSKQQYLLMKHLIRLERAWGSIEEGRKKDFILKWTNKTYGNVNGRIIPYGSILITIENLEVLKDVVETVSSLLFDQINDKCPRRVIEDLYDIAKQTTLPTWSEQKPPLLKADRLETRWAYKKWALSLPTELQDLFISPKNLVQLARYL